MNNYLYYLNEDLFREDKTIKPYEKLYINSVIEFMKDRLDFDAKIIVKKKTNSLYIGDISLNDNSINKNKFTLHYNPNKSFEMQISALIHELTHVNQVSKGFLTSKDYKSITWKDTFHITVKEYNKISKNIKEYMELPWEVEAFTNEKTLTKIYLNSDYFKQLKGKDSTLDFIIDNI